MNTLITTVDGISYGHFFKTFPLLGRRLHTLHCESCKAGGVSEKIFYTGTCINGKGRIVVQRFYGTSTHKIKVVNGVIRAFGRSQSMRRPTRMRLSSGYDNYGETGDELLAN